MPAVATLGVMLIGITGASYWGDESATIVAISRPLPALWRMLGRIDAVHGLYYVGMWAVAREAGTSEFALRLPSALAMAAAAFGIAAIGWRLRSACTGVLAGLVFACLPVISSWGQNARPYAMVVAAAGLASYLLVLVIERPARGRLAAYGASVALLGYLNLIGLLLVTAHGVTVAVGSRGANVSLFRRWLSAAVPGCVAVTPVAVFGWRERAQIAGPAHLRPSIKVLQDLVVTLGGGTVLSAGVIIALASLGVVCCDWPSRLRATDRLAWLCLPWLIMPPVILLIASQYVRVYDYQYLLYCVIPAVLLAGAGLSSLWPPWRVAALAIVFILVLPGQVAARSADGHGVNIRGAAELLAQRAHVGDAVLYPPGVVPDWAAAYPYGFTKLRNIGYREGPVAAAGEYGIGAPLAVIKRRLTSVRRLWVIGMGRDQPTPGYVTRQFRLVDNWQLSNIYLRLYERG